MEKYKKKRRNERIGHIHRHGRLLGLILKGIVDGKKPQRKNMITIYKPDYRRPRI